MKDARRATPASLLRKAQHGIRVSEQLNADDGEIVH